MASSTTQSGAVPQVGSVGALYAITTAEWQTINWWATTVIQLQQLAQTYGPPVPNYPALLAACQQWQAATEAGVFGQSAYVGLVAADMVTALQNLQNHVSGGAPGDPLPPITTFLYKVNLDAAADQAAKAQAALTALAPDVANFVAMNQQADTYLRAYVQKGGYFGDTVGLLNTMGTALQELEAGWSSLISQLQELSAPPATTTQELRADVTSALAAWSALQQSAAAFDAQANSSSVPPPGFTGL